MGATDFNLKQAGVPGMENPPQVTPPPHPAVRAAAAAANVNPARVAAPAPAPAPSSNYVGNGPTDPDVNGKRPAPGVDLRVSAGQAMDTVGTAVFGSDYMRAPTAAPNLNAFAVTPTSAAAPQLAAPSQPAGAPRPTQGEAYTGAEADIINKGVAASQPAAQPAPYSQAQLAYNDRMTREVNAQQPTDAAGNPRDKIGTVGGKPIYADQVSQQAGQSVNSMQAPGGVSAAMKGYLDSQIAAIQNDPNLGPRDKATMTNQLVTAAAGNQQHRYATDVGAGVQLHGQGLTHQVGMAGVGANIHSTDTQAATQAAGQRTQAQTAAMQAANALEGHKITADAQKKTAELNAVTQREIHRFQNVMPGMTFDTATGGMVQPAAKPKK